MRQKDHRIVTACTHRYLNSRFYVRMRTEAGLAPWLWQRIMWLVEDVVLYWAQYGWLFWACGSSALLLHADEVNMLVMRWSDAVYLVYVTRVITYYATVKQIVLLKVVPFCCA